MFLKMPEATFHYQEYIFTVDILFIICNFIATTRELVSGGSALIEFKKEFGRSPDIKQKSGDIKALEAILTKLVDSSKISSINLDEIYNLIFGEVVPVCAIVGGVIAQEVIKAVSHKEVPINNTFLFDPLTYSGTEFTVSA